MSLSRFFVSLVVPVVLSAVSLHASAADGYPVANFSVTANAGTDGSLFGLTMVNPGQLGRWLEPQGSFPVGIKCGDKTMPLSGLDVERVERRFPFVVNHYGVSDAVPCRMSVTAFAPLALDNVEVSSLPVLMTEIEFDGAVADSEIAVVVDHNKHNSGAAVPVAFASDCAQAVISDSAITLPVKLSAGQNRRVRIVVALRDPITLAAANYSTAQALADSALARFDELYGLTDQFAQSIPVTGDSELDDYLRWYMIPAVSLTKCTSAGDIVTMGYCELNQRDSYWTSWVHLTLFPSAERRMIQESVDAITPSGKVPTTILPLIDREDDLDINAFFILRLYRYFNINPDTGMPADWWRALTMAADWLISRDTDGDGIPVQHSFWGDWKDVQGVEGRKYSPFTAMVYIASMRAMSDMAAKFNHPELSLKYSQSADRADLFVNTPVAEGGMWNGKYYVQLWADGSANDRLLQDQTVGILLDVVPHDRALSIFAALDSCSLTPFGVCETYPYYTPDFGLEPATYHNGGVWPWVSFMDDWARIRCGRTDQAIELVKRVARADLVDSGDWSPNEHINSLTGENLGFQLQGWNSNLFGLVYYGLKNPGIKF